jgi:tetratricopeptide (TPR) repeat protein
MGLIRAVVTSAVGCLWLAGVPLTAADNWIEITSPNFTVVSNAGDGAARNVAWQFEQIRSGIRAGWPWASADLDRPFLVIAVKDERTMRAFAPQYWERGVRVRPGSVSAPGLDRHTVLLRTDLRADGPEGVNPYQMAYWGYSHLVLSDAFEGRLPYWFGRGLSELLGNTNVTDREVQFGRVVPWHVAEVRAGRFSLPDLFAITPDSPLLDREVETQRFDAQSWALVHYMLFGDADRAASVARVNELARLVLGGTSSLSAIDQLYGGVAALDAAYRSYVDRGMFRYTVMPVDARVQARGFQSRTMPEREAAAVRAHYLGATNQLAAARVAVDEAKAGAPELAVAFAAEGRLLEREGNQAAAAAAYERAAALGSHNFYVYLRLANMTPRAGATPEALERMRGLLAKAVELNPRSAQAHQSLGGIHMQLNQPADAVAAMRSAVTLAPAQSAYRVSLASALLRAGQRDEALKEAQAALALARTDQQRAAAQQAIARIGG